MILLWCSKDFNAFADAWPAFHNTDKKLILIPRRIKLAGEIQKRLHWSWSA